MHALWPASADCRAQSCPSAAQSSELGTGLPHVKKWVRTKQAIVFRLSNQVIQARAAFIASNIAHALQVNFFDHTKLILDCVFDVAVYVDEARNTNAYRLQDIESSSHPYVQECHPLLLVKWCCRSVSQLITRLSYTAQAVDHMQKASALPSSSSEPPAF